MTVINLDNRTETATAVSRVADAADRAGRQVAAVAWAPKVRITLLTLATFAALC